MNDELKKVALAVAAGTFLLGSVIAALGMGSKQPAAPSFRVTRYSLSVQITPEARSLQASAVLTLESLETALRTVRLYLHDEFTVRSVAENGRSLTFTGPVETADKPMYSPTAAVLDIDLGRELAAGDRAMIRIDYDGPISKVINNVNMITPSLTELAVYSAWFPIEHQNGAFTYTLRLTLPAGHSAVTDGRRVETITAGPERTWVFRRDEAGFDIPLVAGPGFKTSERREGDSVFKAVYKDMDRAEAFSSLEGAVRCAGLMARLFGPPAASGALTVVFSPRAGWGYSRVPLIVVMEDFARERFSTQAGQLENFRGLAHEAAHFWWNVADAQTSDDWLDEALAEYYALRALEGAANKAWIAAAWREQHWAANRIPVDKTILGSLRTDPAAYALYYQKGASIFRTLEAWLGREELDRALVRFYKEHRGRRDASTPSLLAAVHEAFGGRSDAFFDRMLRRGGLPAVILEWAAKGREATVKIKLDGESLIGFPLTIQFLSEDGAETARKSITLAAVETEGRFSLPFQARDAMLDPESWLLRAEPAASFSARLMPLVHGMNMDAFPDLIPQANIDQARAIIEEWAKTAPGGPVFDFERGWLTLLEGRFREAIGFYSAVVPRMNELPNRRFQVPGTFSGLGRAYDLAGDRETALLHYRKGLQAEDALGAGGFDRAGLFQNYLEVPYPGGKLLHLAAFIGNLKFMADILNDAPRAINAKDPYLGIAPIMWAVRARIRRPVIEWLVEHGADLNVRDEKGSTLLEVVKSKGEADVAVYLESKGAK